MKKVFIAALGQFSQPLLIFLGMRFIAETMGPEGYGEFSLLMAISAFFIVVIFGPFKQSFERFYFERANNGRFSAVISYSLRLLPVLLLAFFLIVVIYFGVDKSVACFILIFFWMCREVYLSTAIIKEKHLLASNIQICDGVFKIIVPLFMVYMINNKSIVMVYSYALAYLFVCLVCSNPIRMFKKVQRAEFKSIHKYDHQFVLKYLTPLFLFFLSSWAVSYGIRFIIIASGDGYEAVGVFAFTYAIVQQSIWSLHMILFRLLRPRYFKAITDNNHITSKNILRKWVFAWIIICLPICFLIYLVFLLNPFGVIPSNYENAINMALPISIMVCFSVLANIYQQVIFSRGETGLLVFPRALTLIAFLFVYVFVKFIQLDVLPILVFISFIELLVIILCSIKCEKKYRMNINVAE